MKKLIAALTVTLMLISPANAGTLYFSSIFKPTFADGNIHRISTHGTGLQTVLVTGNGLRSVRVDPVAGKIYWTDVDADVIRRANFDGTNIEDLVVTGLSFPISLALNQSSNMLYWGDQGRRIGSALLDGSGAGKLLATPNFSWGLAVDAANGKIYWSEFNPNEDTGRIMRANLDGTAPETVLNEFGRPEHLALDIAGGKIYWTDYVTDVVARVNVDGTNPETLFVVGANNNPGGIALDLIDRKIYWGQSGPVPNRSDIMRMNLDGSNPEVVATGFGNIASISFIDSSAPVLVRPLGVLGMQPPVFEWTNEGFATWYRLWVTDDSGVRIKQWYKAVDICGPITCSVASQTNTLGIVTWQVRGYDGTYGDWSDRGIFWEELSRPVATTLLLPKGSISEPSPQFEWSVVGNATWYKLQILDSSEQLVTDQWFRVDGTNINCHGGITCKINSLYTFDSFFQWRVRTYNPSGLGPWTDYEPVAFSN